MKEPYKIQQNFKPFKFNPLTYKINAAKLLTPTKVTSIPHMEYKINSLQAQL